MLYTLGDIVKMMGYVAYYRVSTDKHGTHGLGMGAQREAVSRFMGQRGQIMAEYTEVESEPQKGKRNEYL